MTTLTDIRQLEPGELQQILTEKGYPAFRSKQIYKWLWQKGARNFEEMTDLPKAIRTELAQTFTLNPAEISTKQVSNDRTIKCAFKLHDNHFIEGVLIPTDTRITACVSSQVGCSLDCKFCATGYLKRERNLTAPEIYDQVWLLNQQALENYGKGLDNIVYMGMGEPLLNYAEVMRSIKLITGEDGLGMSAQRITVSTAGICKMIKKLADDGARFNLALSLHAASNEKRSSIMPINNSNPLEDLSDALNYWYSKTGTRPTLEYTVILDVNDHEEDASELIAFARQFPCKINLIEYNPIGLAPYVPTGSNRLQRFADTLEKAGLIVNVRRSRGKDIDAACGQLVNKGLISN